MVLMCGLVLTWFADVEFFLTPASTSAAVYEDVAGAAAEPAAPGAGSVEGGVLCVRDGELGGERQSCGGCHSEARTAR